MTFSAWLGTVPAVFWSAIFGSVLTLGGVVLLDRGNSKRQKQHLESAAEEAIRARAANIKKEVYLKTAAELAKGIERLGKISSSDPTKADFSSGFNDFFEIASQFQLIADINANILMIKIITEINIIHINAISRVPAIHSEQLTANSHETLRKNASKKVDQLFEDQTALLKAGNGTDGQFVALQERLNIWIKVRDEEYENQTIHLDKKNKLILVANDELKADLASIGNFRMDLIAQMRRELGFENDSTLYRNTMKKAWEKLEAKAKEAKEKRAAGSQ